MESGKRVTIYDLAQALNISSTTVYRALHNTGRISESTKQRVLDMAQKMNYQLNYSAQALRRGPKTVGVVLCCPILSFCQEIQRGIESAFAELSEYNVYQDMHVMPSVNADQCVEQIRKTLHNFCQASYAAIILFLSGPTEMLENSFAELEAHSIPVVTVVNDIPYSNRVLHVAADGYSAGQMAAELLHLCCPEQRIAILTGSDSTYIHHENLTGFMQEASLRSFSAVDIWEHQDDSALVNQQLNAILNADLPYQGIYITSASTIIAYPRLSELSPEHTPKIVTTDLFTENQALLDKRIICATIFQDPYRQGQQAVKKLYQYLQGKFVPNRVYIPPQMVLRSNMNYFLTAEAKNTEPIL